MNYIGEAIAFAAIVACAAFLEIHDNQHKDYGLLWLYGLYLVLLVKIDTRMTNG